MVKILDMDIGKILIQLQFQTKLNQYLIEKLLNKEEVDEDELKRLKMKAVESVNKYYGGQQMIVLLD
jgi:hypothetical protein